jgi:hypothetical protein
MKLLTIAIIAILSTPVHADWFVDGTITRNLDDNTDLIEVHPDGSRHLYRGNGTLFAGYKWRFNHAALSVGTYHQSNPYRGDDYGQNGAAVRGCFGDC